MSFKDSLKAIRKKKGLSQRTLADLSGISYSMVSKLESGEQSNPSLETIEKIATALEVKPFEIMGVPYWDEKYNSQSLALDVTEIESNESEVDVANSINIVYGENVASTFYNFLSLNDQGKTKASEYIDDLKQMEKYKK